MLRKISTVLLLLSFILMAGCSIPFITGSNDKPDPPFPDPDTEAKEMSVLEALSQDKQYDGKSIVWDGDKVQTVEDGFDSNDINTAIPEDRLGLFQVKSIETKIGIELDYPDTIRISNLLDNAQHLTDTENEFTAESPERYVTVIRSSPDSYSRLEDELSADTELMEVFEKGISQRNYRIFAGKIKTAKGMDMIGVILITPDVDRSAFCIKYAGFGNFSDIQCEGYALMEMFFAGN